MIEMNNNIQNTSIYISGEVDQYRPSLTVRHTEKHGLVAKCYHYSLKFHLIKLLNCNEKTDKINVCCLYLGSVMNRDIKPI